MLNTYLAPTHQILRDTWFLSTETYSRGYLCSSKAMCVCVWLTTNHTLQPHPQQQPLSQHSSTVDGKLGLVDLPVTPFTVPCLRLSLLLQFIQPYLESWVFPGHLMTGKIHSRVSSMLSEVDTISNCIRNPLLEYETSAEHL
jgi:hypothetical protein